MNKRLFLAFLVPFYAQVATAYTIETRTGTQIYLTVPQDSKATVEFSEPVKAISGGKKFSLQPIGADVDERTRQIVDPQIFEVKPLAGDADEAMTFVFPKRDNAVRTLIIRFRAKPATNGYYRIKLPSGATDSDSKGFLRAEKRLMSAMLCDEESYARQILNEPVKIPNEDDISFTAVRRFEGQGLTGYVFLLTNKTRSNVSLDLSALKFGKVNAAIMAHVDKPQLAPCRFSERNLGALNPCQASLRIIVRGEQSIDALRTRESGFPFVVQSKGEAQ